MLIRENINKEIVNKVREKLKENNGYCPCKLRKIPENRCMCKQFIEQDCGLCQCGLYEKIEP